MHSVLRESIKEDRGNYFVEYRPADVASDLAILNLVFPDTPPAPEVVAGRMEMEIDQWLRRYPVPTMVYAWDAVEDRINTGDAPLMGYYDEDRELVVRHWGLISDQELPQGQRGEAYQARVYKDLPFRLQSQVRKSAIQRSRAIGQAVKAFAFFVVGVPVLIELVSLGVEWLGYLLASVSIATGLWHVARTMSWIRPSTRSNAEADEEQRKEHYFYHCERNRAGFEKLKRENMELSLMKKNKAEARRIKGTTGR